MCQYFLRCRPFKLPAGHTVYNGTNFNQLLVNYTSLFQRDQTRNHLLKTHKYQFQQIAQATKNKPNQTPLNNAAHYPHGGHISTWFISKIWIRAPAGGVFLVLGMPIHYLNSVRGSGWIDFNRNWRFTWNQDLFCPVIPSFYRAE